MSRSEPKKTLFVVDDDEAVRDSLTLLLQAAGYVVESYPSGEAFLGAYRPPRPGCLILDLAMPGLDGLALQQRLAAEGVSLPIIFLSGQGQVPESVRAMKAGAFDFLQKPVDDHQLLRLIEQALNQEDEDRERSVEQTRLVSRLADLSGREREILILIAKGFRNKEIARLLGISYRTVEGHRARIMSKVGADSLQDLVVIAVSGNLISL